MDKKMMNELVKAVNVIASEKGIDKSVIASAMEAAMAAAYKKKEGISNVKSTFNIETGEIKMYICKTVVEDEDFDDEDDLITLKDAKEYKEDAVIGDVIDIQVPLTLDFGRVAAGTAKQVVVQKIKEAEKNLINEEFKDKQDELLVGILSREDSRNYYVDLGKTSGVLPKDEIIPGEKLEMGSSIKAYVSKLEIGPKGLFILLSRRHYGFVKRLLEAEIPELIDGTVILHSVARDAGSRSKIAVSSNNPHVDAIGAVIGERGSRINRILKQLNGEKIDVILYDADPRVFIANALSPAKNLIVKIMDEKRKEALVIVDNKNSSLAIGKKGQNVKLASRLTRYKIEIKNVSEVSEDVLESDNSTTDSVVESHDSASVNDENENADVVSLEEITSEE
mgnify:FL=1